MLYEKVKILSCYDGDTVVLEINLFINRYFFKGAVRLSGINAPELHNEGGIDSRKALMSLIGTAKKIRVQVDAVDKYGRPLATIEVSKYGKWVNVNNSMLDGSFAKPMTLLQQINMDEEIILPYFT